MTIDERAEPVSGGGPKLPSTKQIDKSEILQAQLSQVLARITDGFRASEEHFDKQDKTLARLADESVSTSVRLGNVERSVQEQGSRLVLVEDRAGSVSIRTKAVTASDEGQNLQISSLAVKVDELTGKVDTSHEMLTTITSILDKPLVKKISYAAGALLLAALTAGTGYFARGSERPVPPTIIQLPPVAR